MANCYDIEILINYFSSGDSYEIMLLNKNKWEKEVVKHNKYFKKIATKEKYQKEWQELYGKNK